MARKYKVIVYARRNSQPAYSYVAQARVKASKRGKVLLDTARDIASHESRSLLFRATIDNIYDSGIVLNVTDGSSYIRFVVRAWPLG